MRYNYIFHHKIKFTFIKQVENMAQFVLVIFIKLCTKKSDKLFHAGPTWFINNNLNTKLFQ